MKISNKNEFQKFIENLGQIPRDQISIVYENDNNDGPVEGMCNWKGNDYYFVWYGGMDEEKDEMIKKFLIINLTNEQIIEEKIERTKFIDYSRRAKLNDFYEEQANYPIFNVDKSQVVGWFAD